MAPVTNGELGHDDSSGNESDSDSSIITIESRNIPQYFVTRYGRRFHSHGTQLPYPLPADNEEIQRLTNEHEALKSLMGGVNYFGPVPEVLSNEPGVRKKGIDLCTGCGLWVEEMAIVFPHVKFYGVDIVPIASQYPPENAQFEIHDVTDTPLRWGDKSMHLVHIRHASLGIRDYPALLREVARLLLPNGLFLSREWARDIYMDDGSELQIHAPGAHRFYHCLNTILAQRGIHQIASRIPTHLERSGFFKNITSERDEIVLADLSHNTVLSARFKDGTLLYAHSMRTTFLDAGKTPAEADELVAGLADDLMHVQGLKIVSHTVHARRIEW